MFLIIDVFSNILNFCYAIVHNYGWAIILFTLLSKIILLPISIWVHKNSIKMIKMKPEINQIKIDYFGDGDTIAEEEHKIYKKYGYNPFASIIPLFLQVFFLIGVIGAIKKNMDDFILNLDFLGMDLMAIPAYETKYFLVPVLAGLSAYILCLVQNRSNVLHAEQGKIMQYGTMVFSVGLSLYLGWYVALGVALYWITSNILSIVQLYLLNLWKDPKKVINYSVLDKTREELSYLRDLEKEKKKSFFSLEMKREKRDYKKFFSVDNKHLVFYSESSGFYKYFRGIIEYLIENTNIIIHYITSDAHDIIFKLATENTQIKPYYIGEKKLITLMMKMDADIVVMTMPDLQNYHIKRSYVRKDIQYIFIPHSMCSLNLTMRKGSMNHFDTIFCTGKHQKEEIQKTEQVYHLSSKKLIDWGYCLLDQMVKDYTKLEKKDNTRKYILIAPSWQKDNIIDSCLDILLEKLKGKEYDIIVRPHPQQVRHQAVRMEMLKEKFAKDKDIEIQTDFSSNHTVFEADIMITDWSGIAYEYAFTTYRPVIFIDVPLKIMNPEYRKIDIVPFNIWIRDILGKVISLSEIDSIVEVVQEVFKNTEGYRENIQKYAKEYVYNLGTSDKVGALYIIKELQKYIQKRKNNM